MPETINLSKDSLPTVSGYYWILQDIGISEVWTVGRVAVIDGELKIISPWTTYTTPLAHNPNFYHKQFVPFDIHEHRAWQGPLKRPEFPQG